MDTYIANGLINSNSYHRSSENAEISVDNVVAAVVELNVKILQLQKEIVAFKNENLVSSVMTHNSSSLTRADFNRSTKNGENRATPRRNFKGDDSLRDGTDLSARLSFAKRAREVKAANEAAVFKEDYPRDDKSIEVDERPNRSCVSGTYRKSISDAEKSWKKTDESPGDARDTEDATTSRVTNEKLRKLNEQRNRNNGIISETGCSPANVITSKIKRKRISRGVQCASIECRSHAVRFLINCFQSRSKRRSLARKAKRKKAPNKFNTEQNEVNGSSSKTIINDKFYKVIEEKISDTKKDKFEKIREEKMERIAYGNDTQLPASVRNMYDGEKSKDDSKYRKVKINLLEKLRLRRALTCKNDSKAEQNGSRHESPNDREEIARLSYGNERVNSAHKRGDGSQSVKIVDREMDSSNGRKTITSAVRESDINKIKERLDSYIVELNGIIGDACVIFRNRKKIAGKNNSQN